MSGASGLRVLHGLDRLPRSMPADDPRLPGLWLDAAPLRLNSHALLRPAMAVPPPDHAGRLALLRQHLLAACGDYAGRRRALITAYLAFAAADITRHAPELARRARVFDGLFRPEDWLWSALRPLPRAWIIGGGAPVFADIAFWTGRRLLAVLVDDRAAPPAPWDPIEVLDLARDDLAGDPVARIRARLPVLAEFWRDEMLPRSPVRRDLVRP